VSHGITNNDHMFSVRKALLRQKALVLAA